MAQDRRIQAPTRQRGNDWWHRRSKRRLLACLLLREFSEEDAEACYELTADPRVARYTGDGGLADGADV